MIDFFRAGPGPQTDAAIDAFFLVDYSRVILNTDGFHRAVRETSLTGNTNVGIDFHKLLERFFGRQ